MRTNIYKLFALLLSLCAINSLMAQSKVVSGKVTDKADGSPIIGCTVFAVDSTIGTVTDLDGNYSVTLPSSTTVLEFSYIGYETIELEIGVRTTINVEMGSGAEELEEVVVVGYGTQKKVSVTGAIAQVTGDDISMTPSSDVTGSLQGKLPGLSIMQQSGQPGEEDFDIRLRGVSTFNDDSQGPLILVDGVQRDNMSMVDPNEIAAISILKDASATAVYGVRGANGVILITTKVGDSGKPKLSVSWETGIQSVITMPQSVSSYEYAVMENQALANHGYDALFTDRQLQEYKNGNNPLYPSVDWFDETFNDLAMMYRANANLSGSNKNARYFINVGYLNQDGMANVQSEEVLGYNAQYNLNRFNIRSNIDIDVNSWITASLKLASYINKVNRPGDSATTMTKLVQKVYQLPPYVPFEVDPSFAQYGIDTTYERTAFSYIRGGIEYENPYATNNWTGFTRQDNTVYNTSFSLDFDLNSITKGLSARGQVSYDIKGYTTIDSDYVGESASETSWVNYTYSVLDRDGVDVPSFNSQEYVAWQPIKTPVFELGRESYSQYDMNVQAVINYDRSFGDHNIGGMFVYQYDNSRAKSGTHIELLPYNRIGYAARATYRYSDKYMAEFNAGYNGSEQFAAGNRFGFFPAASIGWLVSNEDFLKNSNTISNLKLRASLGKVGNDKLGDSRFLYLDNNQYSSGVGYYQLAGSGTTAYYIEEILYGNEDLTWETALKQNYGFDLTLFNNLNITFDYFREYRKNILMQPNSIPDTLGVDSELYPSVNAGEMKNHGIELDISYRGKITKDLGYSLRGTFTYARNQIVYMDEVYLGDDYLFPYRSEGFSSGQNFGYMIDWNSPGNGYFTSEEEIFNYAEYLTTYSPRVGDFVYQDLNNDGYIDEKDQVPIGSPSTPEVEYSFTLGLNYKSFDFSAQLYGIGNSHIRYSSYGISETAGVYQEHHINSWTAERYASGVEISYPALAYTDSSSLLANDFFIQNRMFVRLKSAELGYTLPKKASNSLGIERMRIYTNANNLFTFDKLEFDTVDPEQTTTNSVLPLNRIINLGLNIIF